MDKKFIIVGLKDHEHVDIYGFGSIDLHTAPEDLLEKIFKSGNCPNVVPSPEYQALLNKEKENISNKEIKNIIPDENSSTDSSDTTNAGDNNNSSGNKKTVRRTRK